MTFPGILFSVKGSEIKECYESKAMEKIVHLKETSDKFAQDQDSPGGPLGGPLGVGHGLSPAQSSAWQRYVAGSDIGSQALRERSEQFRKFVDRTEHEAKRLRILAEHIESDRIYYLTESQLVEIGLLPGLR